MIPPFNNSFNHPVIPRESNHSDKAFLQDLHIHALVLKAKINGSSIL